MLTKLNYESDRKKQAKKDRMRETGSIEPIFITTTGTASQSGVKFIKQKKRKSHINFDDPTNILFPTKLRDKTMEVRERRAQKLLDEDEYSRKKNLDIEERMKKAEKIKKTQQKNKLLK
mmetsp:Transcript_24641/g.21865  ORF Transcript_24641/g.21865 Transcript_24641/m.21865 type:complete len:119 (+) Transcript_24641:288-644(+)